MSTPSKHYPCVGIRTCSDYSPFGVELDVRTVSGGYRFGFQNQEKDDEIKGEGNSVNYLFRMHDSRLGRFFTVDPLAKDYQWNSSYAFSENMVTHMIELEGLQGVKTKTNNVYFIKLKNATINYFERNSNESFTYAASNQNSNLVDYSINLQQYSSTSFGAKLYYIYGPSTPQPSDDYKSQGYIVENGRIVDGMSSSSTFYFAQNKNNCTWSCGQGDVPKNSFSGFGGGIPIVVNGLKYGETNLYSANAPKGLPLVGYPGKGNEKYLVQRSNLGFKSQNDKELGKTIIGYNSKTNEWLLVIQEDGVNGMKLTEIRDKLVKQGFDNVLSFDGSTSSCLIQDSKILITPSDRKNNTIPSGITFSVK